MVERKAFNCRHVNAVIKRKRFPTNEKRVLQFNGDKERGKDKVENSWEGSSIIL